MEPTVYRPHGAIARFVEYFWTFDWRQGEAGQALKMFATGVSGILFQHHDGRPALGSAAHEHPVRNGGCPTSFVYGKRTRPSQTFAKGPFGLTGVVFKPVSPHQYIRIVRFREALRLIRGKRFERLSDVAYYLNYADQSHFIKDIKAFSGYTPTGLVQTVREGIDLPCAVILARTTPSILY